MNNLIIIALIITTINIVLMSILNLTAKKSFYDRKKSSPFECGFDPSSSARLPFSLHFFLIAMIFLVFDVEITLIVPLTITLSFNNIFSHFMMTSFFLLVLLIGLLHEWKQGALNWSP